MPTNLRAFASALTGAKKRLRQQHSAFQKQIFLAVAEGTAIRTPIKTGKLLGGWRGSAGSINDTDQPEDPGGNRVRNQARQLIASLPSDSLVTLFWSTPVSYAPFVEEGSSSQAPAGMLDVTEAEVEVRFNIVRT
jgi:hypothetical protein